MNKVFANLPMAPNKFISVHRSIDWVCIFEATCNGFKGNAKKRLIRLHPLITKIKQTIGIQR